MRDIRGKRNENLPRRRIARRNAEAYTFGCRCTRLSSGNGRLRCLAISKIDHVDCVRHLPICSYGTSGDTSVSYTICCSGYLVEELGPVRTSRSEVSVLYTLFGICLLVAVAVLSTKEQRKGAWLLAAVVIILVIIADRNHWIALPAR